MISCVCVGLWCVLCHLLPGSVPQSSSGQHHFTQPDHHRQQRWTVSLPGESSQLGVDWWWHQDVNLHVQHFAYKEVSLNESVSEQEYQNECLLRRQVLKPRTSNLQYSMIEKKLNVVSVTSWTWRAAAHNSRSQENSRNLCKLWKSGVIPEHLSKVTWSWSAFRCEPFLPSWVLPLTSVWLKWFPMRGCRPGTCIGCERTKHRPCWSGSRPTTPRRPLWYETASCRS